MNEQIIYYPDTSNEKLRLDKYLSDILNGMSRSHIQALIKNGDIVINDRKVKAAYLLSANDKITIRIPAPKDPEILPEDIPLDIYYEDDDIIVVNKPKGMVVHPSFGHYSGTLVNALMYHCKDSLSGVNGVMRPGIVHRIDKDTTGLLIACKNDRAHNAIASQLKRHDIKREYLALCYGGFKEETITIDVPIGRNKKERKEMAVLPYGEGRRAVTQVKVLESFGAPNGPSNQPLSLIRCILETGRTHQIRVHMRYMGHPLAGDETYGIKKDPLRGEGQYLHAAVLGFAHPVTGERLNFEAPLPEYFEDTLGKLRKV